jgi:hypothetical protein
MKACLYKHMPQDDSAEQHVLHRLLAPAKWHAEQDAVKNNKDCQGQLTLPRDPLSSLTSSSVLLADVLIATRGPDGWRIRTVVLPRVRT